MVFGNDSTFSSRNCIANICSVILCTKSMSCNNDRHLITSKHHKIYCLYVYFKLLCIFCHFSLYLRRHFTQLLHFFVKIGMVLPLKLNRKKFARNHKRVNAFDKKLGKLRSFHFLTKNLCFFIFLC